MTGVLAVVVYLLRVFRSRSFRTSNWSVLPAVLKPPARKPFDNSDCTLSNLSLTLSVDSGGGDVFFSLLWLLPIGSTRSITGNGKNRAPDMLRLVCTEANILEVSSVVIVVTGCSVVAPSVDVDEGGAATCSVVVGAAVVGMDIVPLTTLFVVTTDTTAPPIKMELSTEVEFIFAIGGPRKAYILWLPSIEEPSSLFVIEIGVSKSFSSKRSEDEESFTLATWRLSSKFPSSVSDESYSLFFLVSSSFSNSSVSFSSSSASG